MRISRERLLADAAASGFRPEVMEKVLHLVGLLQDINRHPLLNGRLALKGGTALNLFYFDLPRLSVDIDLNYIGAEERGAMLAERPRIIEAVNAICRRAGLAVRTKLDGHAGITWHLRYDSSLGQQGNLKIDLNFMFRVPLWAPVRLASRPIGSHRAEEILVLDLHELAAGKLAALLSRHTSRDLFDAFELLVRGVPEHPLDTSRLRTAFVVYGGINREDWRRVGLDAVDRAALDLHGYLLPLLRNDTVAGAETPEAWSGRMAEECRSGLAAVLPLSEAEMRFLDGLLERGEVNAGLLTEDEELAGRIRRHPGLAWKALNVRGYRQGMAGSAEIEET